MTHAIVVPRLGWNMEQGVFLGWLKRGGELVRAGEPLFTLEGDKAVQEIEAVSSGILRIAADGPKEGDTVPVGAILGHLGKSEEAANDEQPLAATVSAAALPRSAPEASPASLSVRRSQTAGAPAAVQRHAITPRARRAARQMGINTDQVQGSGRNGRIRERDILGHASIHSRPVEEGSPESALGLPLSPMRRTIAARMVHSLRTTAPVTLTTTVDAANLVNLRGQFVAAPHASDAIRPSYTDLFVKLTARALARHPQLNTRWQEDRIVSVRAIHIGVAVDTDAGLLVPVVRDVSNLTLRQVAQRTRTLAEKAWLGLLTTEEMQGGTFTISNLGALGIDAFTPIINWPECAILGIGRIRRQPVVMNHQIVAREQVTLSLTFDHRVVDGAPAARFLQTLCQGVENPSAWLVE